MNYEQINGREKKKKKYVFLAWNDLSFNTLIDFSKDDFEKVELLEIIDKKWKKKILFRINISVYDNDFFFLF